MEQVSIIGAGAAGLMAAQILAQAGVKVCVYERMASPARKFLLAGRGGLNLTHSEAREQFLTRYSTGADFLTPALEAFSPQDLRAWAQDLGEETFVGSSGRVFPVSFKASPLLRAWLRRLRALGVEFKFNYNWQGEDLGGAIILAMGGGSWPRMGSNGGFVEILRNKGIEVKELKPANMGFCCAWSPYFREKFAGQPLKSCAFMAGDLQVKGEAMVTAKGLEGGAIYALSSQLREEILLKGEAVLTLDLKPEVSAARLEEKLQRATGSLSNRLRKIGLSPLQISLLHECNMKGDFHHKIKALEIKLKAFSSLEKAISTAGGVALHELNADLSLKKYPHIFCAGEMLDVEAPTGGYLLQAAFSTGVLAARGILARVKGGV